MEICVNSPKKTRNNKVLIIDDNLINRISLEDMLKASGYEIRYAENGEAGLDIVSQWHPAVVIVDLIMPGMDGATVCKTIREMNLPYRPSLIAISAKGDKGTIAQVLCESADDFIVKPIDELELAARVKALLRVSEFYRELEEDKRNLETLLDITQAVSATLDSSEVLKTIVNKVAGIFDAERCSIVLIAKENEGYVLASHDAPSLKDLKIDLKKYPEIRKVMSTRKELVLKDMVAHPIMSEVREKIFMLQEMSMLIVPIVFNDEVLATIFLRARRKDTGFSKKEIDFCKIVANATSHALKNARLYEKLNIEKEYLKDIAVKDQLTLLYNHNFFYSRLEEEFERAVRYETPLSIIMMDIDDFKQINDTYGHRVGDLVIKGMAQMIKKGVRKTDIVARYGGEEFAVILPHTNLEGGMEEAGRLKEIISTHTYGNLISRNITMSFGVAAYPKKGMLTAGDLVNFADDALYKAKRAGKNCVMAFDKDEAEETP